jgi:Zn-dependent peptidase ImmA (M78 family)
MAETVPIKPELIDWAIDRSRVPPNELAQAFKKLNEWRSGKRQPTLRQLELFADKTMTPLGYFFLDSPPDEQLSIPDFRTVADTPVRQASPNLIETIQTMRRRQAWMREFLVEEGQEPLQFVGSAKNVRNVVSLAARIRETLGLNVDWAEAHVTWEEALRTLSESADRIGIMIAASGVVGLNTHRALDPQEFRGFVLCDDIAPLVFVNSADPKSARMFTLAHELAHVWVGRDGLFNLVDTLPSDDDAERFCNQVAAEFLVPGHKLSDRWQEVRNTERPFQRIASWFKVSPVVAARRALDLGLIGRAEFFEFYKQDRTEWEKRKAEQKNRTKRGGPNFYDVQDTRLGRKFAYAVVRATREGRLLYGEAYQLTDLKGETFNRYANRLLQKVKDERR